MDTDDKAAARAKWKHNQQFKKQRGRGRGPATAPRQHSNRTATTSLDTNTDRYVDEVEEDNGEIKQKSQGADLAQLIAQTSSVDPSYYSKLRYQLVEDYGLPPETEGNSEVFSIDLNALAACLSNLPLHEVLNLDDKALIEHHESSLATITTTTTALPSNKTAVVTSSQTAHQPPQTNAPQASTSKINESISIRKQEAPITKAAEQVFQKPEKPIDDEEELDVLLNLTAGAPPPPGTESKINESTNKQKGEQSLEDWLDAL